MKRLVRKMVELEKWKQDIRPNIFRVVEKLKMESSICHHEYSENFKYQVKGALEMSSMCLTYKPRLVLTTGGSSLEFHAFMES